jgi:hypothetical protein
MKVWKGMEGGFSFGERIRPIALNIEEDRRQPLSQNNFCAVFQNIATTDRNPAQK